MPDMIRDGKGTGRLATVNSENQLDVFSVIEEESVHIAHNSAMYFSVISGSNSANSTNEHFILYIKNIDTINNLFVRAYVYGWNGGNSNHNRGCIIRTYKNPSAPTLNYSTATPGNLNWSSSLVSMTTCYKWDGTATDGMTMSSLGTLVYENWIGQGLTVIDTIGVPILGYGSSIGFSMVPEEIGKFSLVIRFFMKKA